MNSIGNNKVSIKSPGFIVWFLYFTIMLNFYVYSYIQLMGQFMVIVYLLFLIRKYPIRKSNLRLCVKYIGWYGLFVFWAYLSKIWAVYDEREDQNTLLTIFRIFIIRLIILYYLLSTKNIHVLVKAILYAGCFFELITIANNPPSVWGNEAFVSFGNGYMRNGVASITLMMICFLVFFKHLFKSWILYGMLCLFGISILLCGSRRALLMLMVFIFLYIMTTTKQKKRIQRLSALGIILIVALGVMTQIPYIYDTYVVRIEQMFNGLASNDTSTVGRLSYIKIGWSLFLQRPILGWGTDAFYSNLLRTGYRVGSSGLKAVYSHNNYIEILVSYGLVGLVIFYRFHVKAFIASMKKRKTNQTARFIFIMMIVCLVSDFGGIMFTTHILMYFLVLLFYLYLSISEDHLKDNILESPI